MKFNGLSFFLIGLGAGAAAMLLLAPKSGKDTRRYIRRRVDDGQEFIERNASKVQDLGTEILTKSKETIKRANGALTDVVEAGRSAVSAIL
jgi:gas vesicle protein